MLILVLLTIVAFLLSISLGVYVLAKNPRADANRLFTLISLILGLWYIGTAFQLSAATVEMARAWFQIATLGWFFISPFFTHFALVLTENRLYREKWWLILFLYFPAPLLTYKNLTADILSAGFIRTYFGWSHVQAISPWTGVAFTYMLLVNLIGLGFLLRWGRKSSDPIHRVQARIIIISLVAGMVLYGGSATLALTMKVSSLSSISQLFSVIWQVGIAWVIMRYRLLLFSPEDAAFEIFTTMADGVLLVNRDQLIMNANPAAYGILGAAGDDLLKYRLAEILPDVFGSQSLKELLEKTGTIRDMETVYRSGGQEVFLSLSASRVLDGRGSRSGAVIVLRDITERKHAEKQLHHMATHDVLTNLPNRVLLNDRLKNALARAQRYQHLLAVLFIDLDRFKDINDQYGHDTGDLLLKEVAQRLTASVREYDTVSRLGGDEFVIVLTDLVDVESCKVIVERIRAALCTPVRLETGEQMVMLSIGVALYPLHADNTEDLYKFADMALYRVKSAGRNGYRIYSPEDEAVSQRAAILEKDLRNALSGNELEIYYQPVYDLASARLIAMESLLRWHHPELGVIKPMDFIPLAERSGYIVAIGEWVLKNACRQLADWKEKGLEVRLAINVSARQFNDPALVQKIVYALRENRLEPGLIELEFTESTAMVDVNQTIETVRRLKEHGIGIIIDDFGSGFSSMAWLKHLNAKAIKIDRFFIQNVAHDVNDAAIVKAIVSMAHSMGMQVIAEGIETEEQLAAIREMRWEHSRELACDFAQGFLFSGPVPAGKAAELLRAGRA